MDDNILRRIRRAVLERSYQVTDHALEPDDDDLSLDDLLDVLLNGELISILTEDPRGPRFVMRGMVSENAVDVVCRFRGDGRLLIVITAYALK